jgi:SAM-dependent methyltransferase
MLSLAEMRAREMRVAIETQPAGFLSFGAAPASFDVIVSEFALHHLPDFWKAVALSRIHAALKPGGTLFLRDVVFVRAPDGRERTIDQWVDFVLKNHGFSRDDVATHLRDEHSTFGWVMERLLADAGFSVAAEYQAPIYGSYRAQKPVLA